MGWRDRHRSRRRSAAVWRVAASTTVVVGVFEAFLVWGVWGPVWAGLALAVPTFAACVAARTRRFRPVLRTVVQVSVAIVGAAGLLASAGGAGLAWLLLLTATSPFVQFLVRTRRLLLDVLDDVAIRVAWRRSYVVLGVATGDRRVEVVHLRQLYLDGLCRRHPVELQGWLADGDWQG